MTTNYASDNRYEIDDIVGSLSKPDFSDEELNRIELILGGAQ